MTATDSGWGRWVRHDVSQVRPLGSYDAKRCPVRTQLDVLRPGARAGVSEFLVGLGDAGNAFETEVFDELAGIFGSDEADGELETPAERERATVEAMLRGEAVISGGRLPTDEVGRRNGEPDLLVRVGSEPVAGRWRYAPVDVKSHGILRPGRGIDVVVQDLPALAVPGEDVEPTPDGRRDGTARSDAMQLAHYHRMLEAMGHASSGHPWGGILGAERIVAWFRLDRDVWSTPTADPAVRSKRRSSLDVYDFEFGFRLDIAAVAGQHLLDPTVDLLVAPMDCSECPECPWRNHCWPQLEDAGDVSLLPGLGYDHWRRLHDAGLGTIEALADADEDDLPDDGRKRLVEFRLQARARRSEDAVHVRDPRLAGARLVVPGADVEVDVDMENVADGAYLWGATVTVNRADLRETVPVGHRSFVTWRWPLDEDAVGQVFAEFWAWLGGLRQACEDADATFMAFCWSQAAENRFLRLGGDLVGAADDVEAFIASDEWVDLLAWFRATFVTGHGNGLKPVATRLGFSWRDEDPGGAASMTWYRDAVAHDAEPTVREAARQRLLAYNEDDVLATKAVRAALRAGSWGPPP